MSTPISPVMKVRGYNPSLPPLLWNVQSVAAPGPGRGMDWDLGKDSSSNKNIENRRMQQQQKVSRYLWIIFFFKPSTLFKSVSLIDCWNIPNIIYCPLKMQYHKYFQLVQFTIVSVFPLFSSLPAAVITSHLEVTLTSIVIISLYVIFDMKNPNT